MHRRSCPTYLWVGHILGLDEGVEFGGGDEAELDGGFPQAEAFVMRGLGDFGGVVVADFGRERGDQHQRIVHVAVDGVLVRLDAADAMLDEAIAGVRSEERRVGKECRSRWGACDVENR